jgi:hypothetical protein
MVALKGVSSLLEQGLKLKYLVDVRLIGACLGVSQGMGERL